MAPDSILKRLLTQLASQEHVSDPEEEEDSIMWAAGVLFGGKLKRSQLDCINRARTC